MHKKTEGHKKHKDHICPRCTSDDIEGAMVIVDSNTCQQDLFCADCYFEWTNHYKLKGWTEYLDEYLEVVEDPPEL